ncbi:MAG: S-layer homology domain-containing protein [Chloroflexia bacterium]
MKAFMWAIVWAGTLIVLLLATGSGGAASGKTSTPSCPVAFRDVPADSVFYPYVECLTCAGIMGGYDDGTFRVGGNVPRGDMARFISLAAGFTDMFPADQQTFVDVPPTDPNWLYIERLYAHGIINGYPCGVAPGGPCPGKYWHPENLVTRAQTAKLVTLAAGYSESIAPTKQTFREVPPTHPYWVYVERAVVHGLVSGYDCDNVTFNVCGPTIETCPGPYYRCCQPITRSQAAKMIALAFYPSCGTR